MHHKPTPSHTIRDSLFLAYFAFILYASLFPFLDWRTPNEELFSFLSFAPSKRLSADDLITNVLAYIPLGFLFARFLDNRRLLPGNTARFFVAISFGFGTSFFVESMQQFIPGRVAAFSDLATNILGTSIGAFLGLCFSMEAWIAQQVVLFRRERISQRYDAHLGAIVVLVWAASQLCPFVPSFDPHTLHHGIKPLLEAMKDTSNFQYERAAQYCFSILGLGLLACSISPRSRPILPLFAGFVFTVLFLKGGIVSRQISLESLVGSMVGITLAFPFTLVDRRVSALFGFLAIINGFICLEITPEVNGSAHAFNWIPLKGHLNQTLIGLNGILEIAWPALALSFLLRSFVAKYFRVEAAVYGGLALVVLVFSLEWYQQYIPGRSGDITTVIIVGAAWIWMWASAARARTQLIAESSVGSYRGTPSGLTPVPVAPAPVTPAPVVSIPVGRFANEMRAFG